MTTDTIKQKIEELADEMKKAGLWKDTEAAWVKEYHGAGKIIPDPDFFEWLQFVYLPNRLMNRTEGSYDDYITIQAKKYADKDLMNEKLIQLLVELDAV